MKSSYFKSKLRASVPSLVQAVLEHCKTCFAISDVAFLATKAGQTESLKMSPITLVSDELHRATNFAYDKIGKGGGDGLIFKVGVGRSFDFFAKDFILAGYRSCGSTEV